MALSTTNRSAPQGASTGGKTTSLEAIKRRQVGGREWRHMLEQILASERADIERLKKLRSRHPDSDVQQFVIEMLEAKVERVIGLTELYHYRDKGAGDEAKDASSNQIPATTGNGPGV